MKSIRRPDSPTDRRNGSAITPACIHRRAEFAAIAAQVRPELLVLVHQLYWGVSDAQLLAEIRSHYDGTVVSGRDLDVFLG